SMGYRRRRHNYFWGSSTRAYARTSAGVRSRFWRRLSARAQALEAVVGRVLVGLAERRDVEGRVDEVVDGALLRGHHLAHVHELGGDVAQHVDAQEHAVGAAEHELDQALGRARDARARVAREEAAADLVVDA